MRTREGSADSLAVISTEALSELRRYVSEFERLGRHPRSVNWSPLYRHKLVAASRPLRSGTRFRITTRQGRVEEGTLLYASEEALVVSRADDCPACPSQLGRAVVLWASQIEHLRDDWSPVRRLFREIDVLVDGDTGLFTEVVVPMISRYSVFRGAVSPEIRALIDDHGEDSRQRASISVPDRVPVSRLRRSRLVLAVRPVTASRSFSFPEETDRLIRSKLRGERAFPPRMALTVTADYGLRDRLWLGAGVTVLSRTTRAEVSRHTERAPDQIFYLTATGGAVFNTAVTYLIKPAGLAQLLFAGSKAPLSFLELRVGAGPSVAWLRTRGVQIQSIQYPERHLVYVPHHSDQIVLGLNSALALDLCFTRRLAVSLASGALVFPGLVVRTPFASEPRVTGAQGRPVILGGVSLGIRISPSLY